MEHQVATLGIGASIGVGVLAQFPVARKSMRTALSLAVILVLAPVAMLAWRMHW